MYQDDKQPIQHDIVTPRSVTSKKRLRLLAMLKRVNATNSLSVNVDNPSTMLISQRYCNYRQRWCDLNKERDVDPLRVEETDRHPSFIGVLSKLWLVRSAGLLWVVDPIRFVKKNNRKY